jgi:2-amino-4-hydroxy-6-hydroxymethyldihydropteridine diphosphokinase
LLFYVKLRETMSVPELAYLSLGSNLANRQANLEAAIERLAAFGTMRRVSSLYETAPVDVTDQPCFLNCVVVLETESAPHDLLEGALAVEKALGRQRTRDKGPRTIDIDILLYGDRVIDEPGLKIPHPAMQERRFVLEPLVEIAPEAVHPLLKKTAREMLAELPSGQPVHRLAPSASGERRVPEAGSRGQ